ncbi:MAG TPA: M15 family metallopeptidase [bacterium]
MNRRFFWIFSLFFLTTSTFSQTPISPEESMKRLALDSNFVEISKFKGVKVDLKYGTVDNFTHTNLYGKFKKCYLNKIAAKKFKKALESLRKDYPGYKVIVFDALRPRSVQWKLWEFVKGTPQQKYVADPAKGSMHNYGFALDIGLLDKSGELVDMGAPFDGFTPLSEPQLEGKLLKDGELTQRQVDNRFILRHAMEGAGFRQLRHEWWHYDALTEEQVRGKFTIVE